MFVLKFSLIFIKLLSRAISSVYGFIALYLLIFAGLLSFQDILYTQNKIQNSYSKQEQILLLKNKEKLSLYHVNNTITVFNYGSFPSKVVYFLKQDKLNFSFEKFSGTVYPSSSLSINNSNIAGIVTSLGNIFLVNQNSMPQCDNKTYIISISVIPQGSGYTIPQGTRQVCQGSYITLEAFPLQGYRFYLWNGSIKSSNNPLTLYVNSSLTIDAVFIPIFSLSIFPSYDGFPFAQQVTRQADIIVYGKDLQVNLTAISVPSGVSVNFSPNSVISSINGTVAKMTVTYDANSFKQNLTFYIQAQDRYEKRLVPYTIVQTPPNYSCCYNSAYNNFFSRLHYAAGTDSSFIYFYNTFGEDPLGRNSILLYYRYFNYTDSWHYSDREISSDCQSNTPIDTFRVGDQIYLAEVATFDVEFNILTVSGGSIYWYYSPSIIGYCSVGIQVRGMKYSFYNPFYYRSDNNQVISIVVDNSSNIYIALTTISYDTKTGVTQYYVEVLKTSLSNLLLSCRPVGFSSGCNYYDFDNILVLGPFNYPALPELLYSPKGYLILDYQVMQGNCNPDNLLVSTNGGSSWVNYGSFTASSYPLCDALSSGTVINDVLYFGGVNSAGKLALWSLNLTSGKGSSETLPFGSASSASLTSVGNILVITFAQNGNIYSAYSYRPYSFWLGLTQLTSGYAFVSLPVKGNTFQIIIIASSGFKSPNPSSIDTLIQTF